MKYKIFFAIFFIVSLGVLTYFAYPIIKNRYFENDGQNQSEQKNSINKEENNEKNSGYEILEEENNKKTTENKTTEEETLGTDLTGIEVETKNEIDESSASVNISADDCDNECEIFKDNEKDLRYCQDICDLSPIKENSDCNNLGDINKDYCFKNQAVSEKNIETCDLISDTKIQSTCRNRVMEDFLENN
jgi:hypothetical protein